MKGASRLLWIGYEVAALALVYLHFYGTGGPGIRSMYPFNGEARPPVAPGLPRT